MKNFTTYLGCVLFSTLMGLFWGSFVAVFSGIAGVVVGLFMGALTLTVLLNRVWLNMESKTPITYGRRYNDV